MELVASILTVFTLGVVELWAAIPAGLALQLHPLAVSMAAAAGAMLGVFLVALPGARARRWLLQRHGKGHGGDRRAGIDRVWTRYGVAGLGLVAPLLVGAPLGTALGVALGAPTGKLMLWMGLGIVLWSALLTTMGVLGLAGIQTLTH